MQVYQQSIDFGQVALKDCGFVPDVILVFVSPGFGDPQALINDLHNRFPKASITGCSTSGEIVDTRVEDNTAVVNALGFSTTRHQVKSVQLSEVDCSIEAGKRLTKILEKEDLKHLLIFSDGLLVNGAELIEGISSVAGTKFSITGGLAGDGVDFKDTFTIQNGEIKRGCVVGLGLYGEDISIGYGSLGGWDSFGIERKVTKSDKSVLYELDGKPALDLYKSFLGPMAEELPASALLFPLSLRINESESPLARTILAIDETEKSMTFAGNIPEGSYVRLMKANVDRLINGAEGSAQICKASMHSEPDFALLISCVGRRLVLKQLVEEEVEAVREVLGDKPSIGGFYSYGELAPFSQFKPCQLHNQTMTITTFSEV